MEKKFYSEWAVYKGARFRCACYSDNKIKLFDETDTLMETPIYNVSNNELEDYYFMTAEAILNEVSYKVYEIENDSLVYKKCLGKDELTKSAVTDFDLVYFQKNHRDYVERDIVYIDERIDRSMAYQIFWTEEDKFGNLRFGNLEDLISADESLEAMRNIFGERMEEDKYNGPGWDIDYLGWVYIDGIQLELRSDFGILTVSAMNKQGNRYISEIAKYFRKNSELISKQKKLKPVVISSE